MEKIDKLSAAVRQLHTATELYFTGKDILSIHTLAGSSHQILEDTAQNKDASYLLENIFQQLFPNSKQIKKTKNIFFNHIRKQQNFLKHANRDPKETLVFKKEQTEGILLLACLHLAGRYDELNQEEKDKAMKCMFCSGFILCKQLEDEFKNDILTIYQNVATRFNLPKKLTFDSEVEFYKWILQAEKWISKHYEQIIPFFEEDIKAYSTLSDNELQELTMKAKQGRFYAPSS